MKKLKIFSVFLSIVLCLTAMPLTGLTVFAATGGDFKYKILSETDKTCEITKYNGNATDLTIPSSIDGYAVTSIGYRTFWDCTSLTSVTIPNSVTSIGEWAFENCTSLTSITIPNSVTSIREWAFDNCTSLASITIPNSVTSIEDHAFWGCTSLTSITIPDSVTSIGDRPFYDCTSLTEINVSKNNINYSSEDGVLFDKNKTELICYPVGKSDKSYVIPDSVTSIGTNAFEDCTFLTSITIPSSVTSIGEYAFSGCTSLTSISIPDSVKSIGDWAFWFCTSLTSITISNSVTSIGFSAFRDCKSLTSITIPDNVKSIGGVAFSDCISLTSVSIPNSVKSIGWKAFSGCTSLTSITIPNSVTSIDWKAFSGCISFTCVTIPNSVTSVGESAFEVCTSLTSVTIPNSVTSIGESAFSCCTSLTDVYYTGSPEEWEKINIGYDNEWLENATIHYNSKMPPLLIGKQLHFENEVYLMNVNDTKEIKAYICDAYMDNGKIVYENKEPVDSSKLNWLTNVGEENKVISLNQNGKVTALSEGLAYLSASVKDDINLSASCWIYVGKPNALEYKAIYDTKQYYAENGFYNQTSSASDCVEIYCLFENRLADELRFLEDKLSLDELSSVSPVTLTATVSGDGLSFSRDSYQNKYTTTLNSISAGKAVDDILMLFPYNITVSPSGNTYTITVTLQSDSFETITEKYTFTVENLANKRANEHIGFVSSNPDYKVSKQNIYGETMATLKNDAEYKWSKYSSLDFENYYEVVFADVLVGLTDTVQLSHASLLPVVKEWVGNYKTILSSVSTMVEDGYTGYLDVSENAIDKLLKKSKYTTDGMKVDDELRDFVLMKLKDKVSIDKINSAFATIDKTKQYYSFFKLGVNITNDIVDFVNGVSVLNSYKDMDDEFKAVVNNLYNQIPSSEKKLKDAVYHYVNVDSYLGYSEEMFNEIRDMAGDITLDIFKSIYKKQVVSSLCKVIGNITLKSGVLFSSTAAFSGVSTALGSFATGWTLGTCISDILCNNSGKSAEMSKIIAISEFSPYVINTLNHYESKLYSDRNNTSVAEFEYAFAMHKATQSYIMARTVRALEIKRDSLIIKLFNRDDYDGLISDILAQKQSIENLKCHTDGDTQTVVSKTKVIAVKCPVDVFIYDENGNEVVRIVNNVKEIVADGISVVVESNEKYIALPMDREYSVKIVATDTGTMEYFVTEYGDGVQRVQTVKKDHIELSTNRTFTGQIPKENDTAPEDYALHYDGKDVIPNDVITTPITGIKLNKNKLEMLNGDTFKLTAVISPENVTNKKVHWYSVNPQIATVDENGNVTAVSPGIVTIRAVTDDWGYVDECTVTVASEQVLGDIDNNGSIDDWDSVLLDRYLAGWDVQVDASIADIDQNGVVDDWDGVLLSRNLAGWK